MPSLTIAEDTADSAFACDCEAWMSSACAGEPFYQEHEGKSYCVLHFPGDKDRAAFDKALERKLRKEDFNFRGVRFRHKLQLNGFKFSRAADFRSAEFFAKADFRSAEFLAEALFFSSTFNEKVDFSSTVFSVDAHFSHTTFKAKVDFSDAKFLATAKANFFFSTFDGEVRFNSAEFWNVAHFSNTTFNERVSFRSAEFKSEAYFFLATFNSVVSFRLAKFQDVASFSDTTFRDYARFLGLANTQVFNVMKPPDFQYARIEKPGHVSFHSPVLHPHWFINVDGHEFDFTNVDWDWHNISIRHEIKKLGDKKVSSAHQLLSIACRQLAVNAEENHRYEEASKFRFWAMDALRRERAGGFAVWRLSWWYWLASGYGERILQAFVVLIGVWLLFALLYLKVGFVRWEPRRSNETEAMAEQRDEVGEPFRLPRAFTYSLGVMTLQKPEARPATTTAQTLVILETILGPLQAALLALAIRRKFTR